MNFEAVDNNPVHFIVLFIVPKKQYHLHLKTLAAIAKLFTRAEVRQRLSEAETREDILVRVRRPSRAGLGARSGSPRAS